MQLVDDCAGFVVSTLLEEPALWDQGIRDVKWTRTSGRAGETYRGEREELCSHEKEKRGYELHSCRSLAGTLNLNIMEPYLETKRQPPRRIRVNKLTAVSDLRIHICNELA